jgi:hypothetical protein
MDPRSLPELISDNKLNRIWYPMFMNTGAQVGTYALIKDQNLPDYIKYTIPTLAGIGSASGGCVLNKYAKNLNIKSPFLNNMLK